MYSFFSLTSLANLPKKIQNLPHISIGVCSVKDKDIIENKTHRFFNTYRQDDNKTFGNLLGRMCLLKSRELSINGFCFTSCCK